MIERFFKGIALVLLSIIMLPTFLIMTLFEKTWKDLLGEFGL